MLRMRTRSSYIGRWWITFWQWIKMAGLGRLFSAASRTNTFAQTLRHQSRLSSSILPGYSKEMHNKTCQFSCFATSCFVHTPCQTSVHFVNFEPALTDLRTVCTPLLHCFYQTNKYNLAL